MSSGRDEASFHAWVAAAVPRAFPCPRLPRAAVQAAWDLAARDIAARLALACAREGLIDASLDEALTLHTPAGAITLPIAHRGGFGLHRPDLDLPRHAALAHPGRLLAALAPALSLTPATLLRITGELDDSVFHLAVARVIAELRVRARLGGSPWPAPLDPENLVIAGHPWHPMCKTRLGLHLHEVLRLAPEGLAAAQVHAVDVAAPLAAVSPDFLDMSEGLFGAPAPGWRRIAVHALQRPRLPRLLGALWGEHVRSTARPPVPARALLSLRTVATSGLHLKLAADLHTTSARRQISPMSSHNGPRLGALIAAIAATDPQTARGLQLQYEPAAAGLDPRALGSLAHVAGQLGVIVRRDLRAPIAALAPGASDAVAWVCAALGERWPGDTRELVAPDLEGMSQGAGTNGHRNDGSPTSADGPRSDAPPARQDMSSGTAAPGPRRDAPPARQDLSSGTAAPGPRRDAPPARQDLSSGTSLRVPRDMSSGTALSDDPTLLHRHAGDPLLRTIASAYPSPTAALQRYVDLLVPPALRLLAAHGVALELHLQNTLVVHRQGVLCGFIARDLGGVRLHRGRLAAAGHRPELAEGSFIVTDDLGEAQTKLAHTLLHAHLGTVFAWAADLLGADEPALWAHTRRVISGALRAWALAEPRLAAACAADETVLLASQVRAKALLRMRLDERVSDYAYTRVDSPLAARDEH